MFTIKNKAFSYTLDDKGGVVSIVDLRRGRELLGEGKTGEIFRLVYKIADYEERSIDAADQTPTEIAVEEDMMLVRYDTLTGPDGELDIKLALRLTLGDQTLSMTADLTNNSDVSVQELQLSAFAGIRSLGEDPKEDTLLTPMKLGVKVANPYAADFSTAGGLGGHASFCRPDHRYAALDFTYPGYSCMQWYCLYNKENCLYVGSHDKEHHIICQHVERRASDRTLRFAVCHYPFLEKGESWTTPPVVYALLEGDWHAGARHYRNWMVEDYGWKAPEKPRWVKEFQGFLRVIFRMQSGEYNYHFSDIPRMFDELQAAGLNTLFLLGWPKAGFARMRPDYVVDPKEAEDLARGIEYVHARGGKIMLFVSYHVVDLASQWNREEKGEDVLVRDLWGNYGHYAETYAADGTYRMMLNNAYKQYSACSGSDKWHEKMLQTAEFCMNLGADGVLFDLGGTKPFFCTAEGHDHKKPNEARASKVRRWAELRAKIKEFGGIIAEEHCIDIYTQYMDFVQPGPFTTKPNSMPEFFRYTFPEVVMTNRNMALSEKDMLTHCNFTYLYGFAFDLSIFRCAGLPSDIPNYTAYMTKLVALRKQYSDYFFDGRFVDEEGFRASGDAFRHKSYRAADGRLGVAVWNVSGETCTQTYTNTETGVEVSVTLGADEVGFLEL